MLADTSAWIEYDRATGSSADLRLSEAIEGGEELWTTGMVIAEMLAGSRSDADWRRLEVMLAVCVLIPTYSPLDFELAAEIFVLCRNAGGPLPNLPDCLIAGAAIRANVPLLHQDAHFEHIAEHTSLQLVAT